MSTNNSDSNGPWLQIVLALISLVGVVAAAWITTNGAREDPVVATAVLPQATAVAAEPTSQPAPPVAATQVVATLVASQVATSPPVVLTATVAEPVAEQPPPQSLPLRPDGVTASSFFALRPPKALFDGKINSAWIAKEPPSGTSIVLQFKQDVTITQFRINHTNADRSRIKSAIVRTPDGSERAISFRGLDGWEDAVIEPLRANEFTITVTEVYPGRLAEDVGVGEMEILGRP
jgi:hypothetical protein